MKAPTACWLWAAPEMIDGRPLAALFEVGECLLQESRLGRRLLKCRCCDQLYFYEFYETVDWIGNDPHYETFIPVGTVAQAHQLNSRPPQDWLTTTPRLQRDCPQGANAPATYWVRPGWGPLRLVVPN